MYFTKWKPVKPSAARKCFTRLWAAAAAAARDSARQDSTSGERGAEEAATVAGGTEE